MSRGGFRVGGGRPKKGDEGPAAVIAAAGKENKTPLQYMLDVMNDPAQEDSRRDRMAQAAAPYVHGRAVEVGKKETKAEAAKKAETGRFAPPESPVMN
jgi:hypothetical protein